MRYVGFAIAFGAILLMLSTDRTYKHRNSWEVLSSKVQISSNGNQGKQLRRKKTKLYIENFHNRFRDINVPSDNVAVTRAILCRLVENRADRHTHTPNSYSMLLLAK